MQEYAGSVVIRKYSKELGAVSWFHEDFEAQEKEYLSRQRATEEVYLKGPRRKNCILCLSDINEDRSFKIRGVLYSVCGNCEHINGMHDITDEFLTFAYTTELSTSNEENDLRPYSVEFTQSKMSTNFERVVNDIYVPKAEFLLESLNKDTNVDCSGLTVLDFGCGSGHFVEALNRTGFSKVEGIDSLQSAVTQAQKHGLSAQISHTPIDATENSLRRSGIDIVSMMCVLPHLTEPGKTIELMRKSGIRWTFQKFPMWSFALLLEAAMPNLRSRVIGADHTNAFTWKSVSWLEQNYGLRRVATWSFGSDSLDFSRKIRANMRENSTNAFINWATKSFTNLIEPLQSAIDLSELSSELHVLWEIE